MKRKIVAFYGPQGSGKSEASKALLRCGGWVKLSFADTIYEMAGVLLGVDARKLDKEAPIRQLGGKTLRQILKTLGTEWGRDMVDTNIWVIAMRRRLEVEERNIVIDDLRFRNEYELLRDMGAEIVRVYREGYEFNDPHASEQDQKDFIHTSCIQNDGSAAFLRRNVRTCYHLNHHGVLPRPATH